MMSPAKRSRPKPCGLAPAATGAQVVTLARLLLRIKDELEQSALEIARVQLEADGQGGVTVSGADLWTSMQNLDLVEQTLRALADVLSRVHDHGFADQPVSTEAILRGLPLAALASRLCGADPQVANDEIEFF